MLTKPELLFGLLSLVAALALIGFSTLFWKLHRVTRDLVTVRLRLEHAPQEPEEPAFADNLMIARIRQQLREVPGHTKAATDRYRYVASLVRNGLEAPQIAEILDLGLGEAEQLVSLSQLCSAGTPGDGHAEKPSVLFEPFREQTA